MTTFDDVVNSFELVNEKQMSDFKQYRRTQIAEMRAVTDKDVTSFLAYNRLVVEEAIEVSISKEDLITGSPRIGDMIARNPKNHKDQWLVSEEYFKDNFEEL